MAQMTLLVPNPDIDFMGDGRGKSGKNMNHVLKTFKEVEMVHEDNR